MTDHSGQSFDPGAMTLAEKVALCSGYDDWHTETVESVKLPAIEVADGPHGLRKETGVDMVWEPATCFPTLSALGSSWDRDLVRRVGEALGTETRAAGVQVLLGPGINMKRSPLCGRNFEYLSEDPVHAGELATAYVRGVQSRGVGTCLKHFAANNQETLRFWVSAQVDERTLREIYLAAFERVVRQAQPWSVMCSYNRINGVHASQNRWLLTQVLRDEWGYQGVVISDWGAVHDRIAALAAGLDLEMPGTPGAPGEVLDAVSSGMLPESTMDESVRRIAALVRRAGPADPGRVDTQAHHRLAREAAAGCLTLLRNEDGCLPIDRATTGSIAVIGEYAIRPRLQGGGSAGVRPTGVDNPLAELTAAAGDGVCVHFELGYQDPDAVDLAGVDGEVRAPGAAQRDRDPRTDAELIADAVRLAASCDLTVVYAGLPLASETEGHDRDGVELPAGQQALLEALAELDPSATGTRLVVVLCNGSAVTLGAWHDRSSAILHAGLAGQGAGWAVAQVLFGEADPSGRLAETYPHRLADTPAYLNFPGERGQVRYGEGVFIGYRWYDATGIVPRYPFGHGLAYTTFEYSPLSATVVDAEAGTVDLAVTVTNTGSRAGCEVVQFYVGDPVATVRRPVRELKAFEKIRLDPGAACRVSVRLTGRDFAFFDVGAGTWRREAGEYAIEAAASSVDIRARATVRLPAGTASPA
ncbi:MAG: glycoside hydrolase family 3 C-terminal domain-containing protein [Micromonosporaceae bacterium]|nr:glycoside hydrolase family 3 C-terminal domain-containing protein [Micromonosporaceae bacterium]